VLIVDEILEEHARFSLSSGYYSNLMTRYYYIATKNISTMID